MIDKEVIIEIDKITSGKNNIISFVRNGVQVDEPLLKLKSHSDVSEYYYNHHFDKEDLERLSEQYSPIRANYSDENINDWAEETKAAFQYLIETGQFDKVYHYQNKKILAKFVWINK